MAERADRAVTAEAEAARPGEQDFVRKSPCGPTRSADTARGSDRNSRRDSRIPSPECTTGNHSPRAPGSRPRPQRPAGEKNAALPIEHIVVIMQENHSFDQYFGRLNQPD